MAKTLLEIENLQVSIEDNRILDGVDLAINAGEIHVLMGQNGAGKSTLGSVIMGNPVFALNGGKIKFEGEDITQESTDARARRGIFLSFQTPQEVAGITLENFLRVSKGAVSGEMPRILPFRKKLAKEMEELNMAPEYAKRDLNVGFSGGERKKSEVLQMLTLDPKLAILDETDSGLDVDAVRTVAHGVKEFHNENNALLIITHNTKLIEDMDIDKVHVLAQGKIMRTGGPELIDIINTQGFCGVTDEDGNCILAGQDGACHCAAREDDIACAQAGGDKA